MQLLVQSFTQSFENKIEWKEERKNIKIDNGVEKREKNVKQRNIERRIKNKWRILETKHVQTFVYIFSGFLILIITNVCSLYLQCVIK